MVCAGSIYQQTTAEIQYLDHMTNVKMQIRVESEERVRERVRRGGARRG